MMHSGLRVYLQPDEKQYHRNWPLEQERLQHRQNNIDNI